SDAETYRMIIEAMAEQLRQYDPQICLGIESRGFIFAAALARELSTGLAIVRKPGKLPFTTHKVSYDLEYGSDTLEIHTDAVARGQRVAVIDDVLATGGTAAGTVRLVNNIGGEVVCVSTLIELAFLNGRKRLDGTPFEALISY
ncbi:MAG: adenine phosphoribosyltransferase, partial [Myxococcales bacterium]|nr:adenine phosphoribosyltransferase [Myxococcales bacterium]